MAIVRDQSNVLQRRATQVMPLGVNSNFRYWGEGMTPYVQKAKGGYLWDVDGNRYIDYRCAFGPIILGHAFDEVDARVHAEIDQGALFAMTGELEVVLVEKMIAMCPVGKLWYDVLAKNPSTGESHALAVLDVLAALADLPLVAPAARALFRRLAFLVIVSRRIDR